MYETPPEPPAPTMVDLSFELGFEPSGVALARDHRRSLAAALQRALPWLADTPGVAVHRLNLPAGGGEQAPLSRRTRLTLRVPLERAAEAEALAGLALELGAAALRVGRPHRRELLPFGTLYAHFVAFEGNDELAFLSEVERELDALAVRARAICGRRHAIEGGALQGFSLMLDGLSPADALRVLERGLGPHRELGCGVFVPHKSAAAVGMPS
jgi:CRISPR-associated protein Cas6